jgi:VWFA-related protein
MTHTTRAGLAAGLLLIGAASGQVRVPARAPKPVFEGRQGKQRTEIHFDPAAGTVTLKLLVQDPNGYFIPNIRRENFVVYENGVRQNSASVDIEHAPASIGLLLENGGRHPSLNRELAHHISAAGNELLHSLDRRDQAAIWMYADAVKQAADYQKGRETVQVLLAGLEPPEISETNLYDALIAMPGFMKPASGRPGIIVVTSCIDTFSKANFEDALQASGRSPFPIYAISLVDPLRLTADLQGPPALQRFNWNEGENRLQQIARASGGRLYSPKTAVDLTAAYDDMLENLKVRYVITYRSSDNAPSNKARTVRVDLVNPATGQPVRITDENGATIKWTVILQESYTPDSGSLR